MARAGRNPFSNAENCLARPSKLVSFSSRDRSPSHGFRDNSSGRLLWDITATDGGRSRHRISGFVDNQSGGGKIEAVGVPTRDHNPFGAVRVNEIVVTLVVACLLAALLTMTGTALASDFTGQWSHAQSRAFVRTGPELGAPSIGRLRMLTEDGLPDVYAVFRFRTDDRGREWARVGLPGRPNGRRGWVLSRSLGPVHKSVRLLRIDRGNLTAKLWQLRASGGMKLIFRSRIGVGAPGTPTPRGDFWIRQRIKNLGGSAIYGPLAFGTSAYSVLSEWPSGGVIGIHGTNRPGLLPGRVSHGCIRMKNGKIRQLARKLKLGTPVEIR